MVLKAPILSDHKRDTDELDPQEGTYLMLLVEHSAEEIEEDEIWVGPLSDSTSVCQQAATHHNLPCSSLLSSIDQIDGALHIPSSGVHDG